MTQTIDLTVATLQESVRHNEKNIDKLDRLWQCPKRNRDLKDFCSEVLKRFEKVEEQFVQLEANVDRTTLGISDRWFNDCHDRQVNCV